MPFLALGVFLAAAVPPSAAQYQYYYERLVEGAGLFWIAFECAILLAVCAARRHLSTDPLPRAFRLTSREMKSSVAGMLVLSLLAIALYARHIFIVPLPQALMSLERLPYEPLVEAITPLYMLRAHTHLIIWAIFVSLWVLLEVAIVYQGWRAFRRIRRLLPSS